VGTEEKALRRRRAPQAHRAAGEGRGSVRPLVPGWLVWGLGLAFVVTAALSAAVVYAAVRDVTSAWSGQGLPALFAPRQQPSTNVPTELAEPTPLPTPNLEAGGQAWNGVDRINILIMGLDYRDWESGEGPPRTDSMMLVTLDPITKSAGMLSIPRDLWVEIPDFEHNRINTAYFLGESYRLPGGGPGLAMRTVEQLMGVPVQYYAVIEFGAFERAIDAIGGLEVEVFEEIKLSPLGKPSFWVRPGSYHFDGSTALAYARARKTEGGDFDRAERQQQVVLSTRDSVFEMGIPELLSRAPALYRELASGIHTNLSFDQMVALGLMAVQIEVDEVRRGVIAPPDMVLLETHPDGSQVLKPVPDAIRQLRDRVFTGAGAISPSVQLNPPEGAARLENARVGVYNGAGVEGLASDAAGYLQAQGLSIVQVANADRHDYDKSRVIVHSPNFPYTLRLLADMLGLTEGQILRAVYPRGDLDLEVVLGVDWVYSEHPY
jgi:LCP family protein required for cell wall assembly